MARSIPRRLQLLFAAALVPASLAAAGPAETQLHVPLSPAAARPHAYAQDHVVVHFRPQVSLNMQRAIAVALGGRELQPARYGDFARVAVRPGESVEELARRLQTHPLVATAELDPQVWLHDLRVRRPPAGRVSQVHGARVADAPAAAGSRIPGLAARGRVPGERPAFRPSWDTGFGTDGSVTPAQTDPFLGLQWTHTRIRLAEAEQINPTRGRGVIVAVIDTGVLSGDGGDCQNAFPRGRGLDLQGVNFLPGIDLVNRGTPPHDEGNADPEVPTDPFFGHGTYVASLIAAAAGNDRGGRGVAPEVSILPIRVFPRLGGADLSVVAEAIHYAVDQGADVINLSLGGPDSSTAERNAILRAHAAGVIVVASAGNEGSGPDAPSDVSYPARHAEVLAVGASDHRDARASYSNQGPGIDIVAPAGDFSRHPDPISRVGANDVYDATLAPTFLQNRITGEVECAYFWSNGTSFAAPQVAAAAAILKSLGIDDAALIRELLTHGARDLAAAGFDSQTGHGLLDLVGAHQGFGFSFE